MTRKGREQDPEGETAGVVSRCLAAVVDALVVFGIALAVQLSISGLRLLVAGPPYRFPDPPGWLAGVGGWAVAVLYLGVCWTVTGGTVGDRLLGLRVTRLGGRLLGVLRALLRAALCVTFPVGLLWVPLSRRRASLQDLVVASAVRYHRF
ncbi:RDD family protein [Streptomyces sp. HD]|uniref:RDD family protein n=1 Tax=Streptomyces sp. HD TaxID=3020892 RepID=UPI00232EAFEA|nr:RDD family protein [Streptomyces sp. HD]MDC0770548.1 RDD family protein [Streptomyces sp. HD]